MKILKGMVLSILSFLLFLSLSVFGIVLTLNGTILKPDFVATEVDKINVPALAKEIIESQLSPQLPPEMRPVKEALYEIIAARESWLKQQVQTALYACYDYLLGKSDHLSLSISLETLKAEVRDKVKLAMKPVFMQSLPAELAKAPQAQIDQYYEQYFNQFYQQFAAQIPDRLEVSESQLPAEARQQLGAVRQYVSYFQLGYKLLIAFMLLLVLGIVLIHRELRSVSRELGITLVSYGAFEYAGILLAKYLLPNFLSAPPGIPASLWDWLNQLLNNMMSPLEMFSLGCLVGGVVLFITSFVVGRRTAEE